MSPTNRASRCTSKPSVAAVSPARPMIARRARCWATWPRVLTGLRMASAVRASARRFSEQLHLNGDLVARRYPCAAANLFLDRQEIASAFHREDRSAPSNVLDARFHANRPKAPERRHRMDANFTRKFFRNGDEV